MKRTRAAAAESITEGVIWRQLLLFFFPILLGTFFQQLYNTVDAMIVGKFVGKEALAAVGSATSNLINLIIGFFVGLSSGATVIISQFYGGRRDEDVSKTVHTAAALALVGGAVLTVLGLALSPTFLVWMGTPEAVMPYAVPYIRIYFLGMIPSMIYNIGSGVLRAVGDSRRPLYFLILACMVNIVLDVVLVVGLEMGASGAAWATILSQAASAVLVILTLRRTHASYQLHPREIRFHGALLRRVVQIGLPAGLQSVMYSISHVIIQTAINGFGTNVLAGWTAYSKLDGLYWMTINAFGVAITTFAGQNFGARRYDRMKRSMWVCLGMSLVATAALSALLLLGGKTLLGLFSDDGEVVASGLQILYFMVPGYVTYLCVEILSGTVRGAGDSLIPTIMTLVGICLLRVVWVAGICAGSRDLIQVLMCYPITWSATSLMFILYYWKAPWLKRCIRRAGLDAASQA